jgi:hypothetical protein
MQEAKNQKKLEEAKNQPVRVSEYGNESLPIQGGSSYESYLKNADNTINI